MNSSFDFTSSLIEVNKESMESIYNQINEGNINMVYKILEYALTIRFLNAENILTLIGLLITKFGYNRNLSNGYINDLLIQQGVTKNTKIDKTFKDIYNIFEIGSIERIIQDDDLDKFIGITSVQTFNPKEKVKCLNGSEHIFNVINLSGHGPIFTYLQLMGFFGSLNCFKHAISTGTYDMNDIVKYAVVGGNKEIIHILEQNNISFDSCFEVSVQYHRYEVSDWLLTHYKCEEFDITKTFDYHNLKAFFFLKENKTDVDQETINDWFRSASQNGHLEVVKYLHEQCHATITEKTKRNSRGIVRTYLESFNKR